MGELERRVETLDGELNSFEIERMLAEENDRENAIMYINAGAGGTEAQDWAEMLLRMYLKWAERKGFESQVVDLLPGEEAGVKNVTFLVKGAYAYGYLKCENGIHRLVRISPFDANARRHTSFASVYAYPEVPESVPVDIREEDLKIDTFRASGPGRAARQQDGVGHTDHPSADRHRGPVPERAVPAQEQGHRHGHLESRGSMRWRRRSRTRR